ncbi:MAG: hypothetical protein K9K67_01135 [Bacteriovoracaceae bacterium]|nr:hypothetical protein [Bacteriovoracaceae bacterium]
MKKFVGLLVAFSITQVFASTPENVAEVKKFAAEKGVKISVGNESEANRSGKKYMLTTNYGAEFNAVSVGATFGYYIDGNKLITATISKINDADDLYDDHKGTVVKIGPRVFAGNSFYLDAGVFYLNSTYTYNSSFSLFDSSSVKEVSIFKKAGATFKIGNQWQWDNFTLGVDWIGAAVELVDLGSKGRDLSEVENLEIIALNLQIGMSF